MSQMAYIHSQLELVGLLKILTSTTVSFLGTTQVESSPGIWASLKIVSGLREESTYAGTLENSEPNSVASNVI